MIIHGKLMIIEFFFIIIAGSISLLNKLSEWQTDRWDYGQTDEQMDGPHS